MKHAPWTEAEKQTLSELFPTHTTEHVAKLLDRNIGSVYAAATRFGIVKLKRAGMTITDKILQACSDPKGKCTAELIKGIDGDGDNIITISFWLVREGRLYKAGVLRHYRFFANEADAKAWDLVAPAAYAEHQRQAAERRRIYNNERGRKAREAAAANKPPRKPKPAPVPKVKAAPSTEPFKKPPTDKRWHIHITNHSKEQEAPKEAKVVWPEHVKVQAIPTPPSRFAFQPPPGWRGQITNDWMDRRLGAAS